MAQEIIKTVGWILIKNRKLLVVKTHGRDRWYVPGGKFEPGESSTQALIREIHEELTVNLEPATIKLYGVFEAQAHGRSEGVLVRKECYTALYRGILKPHAEIEHYDFIAYDQRPFVAPAARLILDDLKQKNLID